MSGELIAAAAESCHLSTGGCGFPAPGKEIFFFDEIAKFTIGQTELAVTKPMILLWLSVVVVVGFFVMTFRKAKVVPGRMQGVAEYGYLFVRDGIARDTIGKEGDRFVPLLFAFFFFIWINNLWGIIPFAQIPVTSKFAIPVAFAAIVYLAWVPLGVKRQGFLPFFKSMTMPRDVPKLMYVLLIPIEILSNFIVRPFTHSVRLFANMFAGHMLIATFSIAAWYLFPVNLFSEPSGVAAVGLLGSAASTVVTIALTGFEMGIQALQAYVFTLLAAVYLNDSVNAH